MKILVIEDNDDHFEIIEDALSSELDNELHISRADTLLLGCELLSAHNFDVCLCDLNLPDSNIHNTSKWLISHTFSIPFVALTSLSNSNISEELLNNGVQDYIEKGDLTPKLLLKTCRYALERWRHQQSIAAYNQDMQIFCASLSHDFNGHISRILDVTKILKYEINKRAGIPDNESVWFDFLEKSTGNVHSLVSDLQQYLSVNYTKKEFNEIDVIENLKKVITAIKDTSQSDFIVNLPANTVKIKAHWGLVSILFQNIISNSIKFSIQKPIINIEIHQLQKGTTLIIKDNGIGFNQADVAKIFDPFYRLNESKEVDGSGLGLSIVKRIIEHHNALIHVDSTLDQGTTFTITFIY